MVTIMSIVLWISSVGHCRPFSSLLLHPHPSTLLLLVPPLPPWGSAAAAAVRIDPRLVGVAPVLDTPAHFEAAARIAHAGPGPCVAEGPTDRLLPVHA